MNKEEAIEILLMISSLPNNETHPKCNEAITMAIEALEAKPIEVKSANLHECPICNKKAGKTYLTKKLTTICQECDHAWDRA